MRPFDPRLIRYAKSTAWLFVAQAIVGTVQTLGVIGMSWYVAKSVVAIFLNHETPVHVLPLLLCAAAWLAARVAATWLGDWFSLRAATKIVWQLRSKALASLDPKNFTDGTLERSKVVTALGHGLQALEPYFRNFVPQLVLTCIATPVLLVVVLLRDPTSFISMVVVLPLIPIFMVLIGWYTQSAQERQWHTLQRLSSHFSDVVSGLTTLRIFRRAYHQRRVLENVSDQYRSATMRVLRVSFLSGFVLELASTIAVALVAVTIGLRLINGQMGLETGLFVLLLAPEVFLPLRNVGGAFHTATEGVQAASEVFAIIESSPNGKADVDAPTLDFSSGLHVRDLTVTHQGVVAVADISFDAPAGAVSVIRGASGTGKTSTVEALMGFASATGQVNGEHLGAGIAKYTSWLPQNANLIGGTVADNVRYATEVPEHIVSKAIQLAAVDLPAEHKIDKFGTGVSGGQQQRIALARAIARALWKNTPLVLLDEPTTGLDAHNVAMVIVSMRTLAKSGFIVLAISHEPEVWNSAEYVIELAKVCA